MVHEMIRTGPDVLPIAVSGALATAIAIGLAVWAYIEDRRLLALVLLLGAVVSAIGAFAYAA